MAQGFIMKRQWQAQLRNWIGASKHGVAVISVRRRGRGKAICVSEAPLAVKDFLFGGHPDYVFGSGDLRGCKSSLGPEFTSFEATEKYATNCIFKYRKVLGHMTASIMFEVDEPVEERLLPINKVVRDIAREIGTDSFYGIYRAIYKGSECGVSVGFLVSNLPDLHPARRGEDARWVYCDSLSSLGNIAELLRSGVLILGVCITGYAEGCDIDLQPHTLTRTKKRSVTADNIWNAVKEADGEASALWDETHGCDDCGSEDEFGYRHINPNCKSCHGDGVIT